MTVAELIAALGTIDPTLRVAINDADTGWCAPAVSVDVKDHPSGERFAVIHPCSYVDMMEAFTS